MGYDELLKKVPPYSLEAEQACIGAMLISQEAVSVILELLNVEDFFDERHRVILKAIQELYDKSQAVDIVTVTERLESTGKLAKAGGTDYLSMLMNSLPSLTNVSTHAKIVLEKSILRALIDASRKIIDLVYETGQDLEKISDEAEKLIFDVTDRKIRTNYKQLKEILPETLAGIDRIHKYKHVYTGLPTGFVEFDDKTSGLQSGDLIVIAGRPSMGKTAFALNVATNVASHLENCVLIFSLEMSMQELALRMLSSQSKIDMQRIRKGNITKEEWDELVTAGGDLSRMQIFVDDTPSISLNEIKAKARRIKSRYNLKLIIIDHLQLITTSESNKMIVNRNAEISYISRNLKALAKELNIPVLVLSQLSRAVENRQDKRPILSDLRESGAIEQDADVVGFLYREEYYNKETDKKNIAELILQKQRNGPTGTIELSFFANILRFENLDKHSKFITPEEMEF